MRRATSSTDQPCANTSVTLFHNVGTGVAHRRTNHRLVERVHGLASPDLVNWKREVPLRGDHTNLYLNTLARHIGTVRIDRRRHRRRLMRGREIPGENRNCSSADGKSFGSWLTFGAHGLLPPIERLQRPMAAVNLGLQK